MESRERLDRARRREVSRIVGKAPHAPVQTPGGKKAQFAQSELMALPEVLLPPLQDSTTGLTMFMLDYDALDGGAALS